MANQNPVTVIGSVYRNAASWWQPTSPPMCGCLKMYMLCSASGSMEADVVGDGGQLAACS